MNVDWPGLIRKLSEPFPPSDLKWRAGSISRDKARAQALPYVDARVCEDRLNALCPGAWSVTFKPWGESRVICELTVYGVTRSSTGESERNPEGIKGTAAEAQAFKRACSKFGLGRYRSSALKAHLFICGMKGPLSEAKCTILRVGRKFSA